MIQNLLKLSVVYWVVFILTTSIVGQKTDDQVFLDGLRSRQLFRLAERFVSQRLDSKEITPTDEGNLVIEWIRLRMAEAVLADDDVREESWDSALAIGDNFLKNRNHPRALVIRVQGELSRLSYGKFLAQQLAAGIAGNDLRARAIEKISQARRELEKLDREIAQALPQAGGSDDELSAQELRSLKKNVQYQLANCNLQAAKLFPPEEKGNRIDALMQVVQRLEQVGSQTNSSMPLWWNVQIDRVEALRLQGKLEEAIQSLNKVSTKKILTTDMRKSDMLRQQIELSLDLGRGDPVQLVTAARAIKQTTPELDLSVVRLMMQTGSAARLPAERDKWQEAATVMTKAIEKSHGAYWGRLAELAVIGDSGTNAGTAATSSTNLDILIRVGDEAWRKKNYEDAVKAFDKAYSLSIANSDESMAMTAGMKAAKILEQQGDHKESGQRLVRIAAENPDHADAAAAHLSGCWNLGRAAAKEKELMETYGEQLASHVIQWPEADTVAQARIWLGRYQGSKKLWPEAFESLIGVNAESPLLKDAARLLDFVASAEVGRLKQAGQPTLIASQSFAQRMLAKLKEAGIGPNDRWTSATRQLLLASTKFSVRNQVGEPGEFGALLKRALSESSDAEPAWQQSAEAWLLVCKASERESIAEAIEAGAGILGFPEPVLAECFGGLMQMKSSAEPSQLDQLKLNLIDAALTKVSNDEAAKNLWMSRKSTILVNSGRGPEAIKMLKELIASSPRRADLQVALAKALSASESRLEEALGQWRKVAAGSKQYSPNWFQAKYFVAKLLSESGSKEDAKKLLDYLKIPPGWEQSELKADFDRLYSELDR